MISPQQWALSQPTTQVNYRGATESPITVLLVDDDGEFVELVAEYLEREHGFTVVTKTHANDALEYLASDNLVDCLVSDYQMPDIDGLDLLEIVTDEHSAIPFVMFAGQGSEEVASRAIQQGADDYLQKDTGETRYDLLAKRIRSCVTIARQHNRLQTFYAAIEDAGHAMLITDRQGTITYVNPTMVALSGYDRDELVGETPAVLKSGAHDQKFYQELWETILNGDVWQGVVINERKDGTSYTIDQTIAPITKADGKITGFVAINRDITDRMEQAQQLRRFRSAVEHAGHAILITDTDGTIEYVNPAFEEMTGYTKDEAIGHFPSILQSGEHDQEFYRILWETILDGDVWQDEVINERKDGRKYVIDQTIAPITAEDGTINGFVAINRDITDRKQRERDLMFLKEAIDQAGVGIGTYDSDGYSAYANSHLADLFETNQEDLKQYHIADLSENLDRTSFQDYWESFDVGERRAFETTVQQIGTETAFPAEVVSSRVLIEEDPYQVVSIRDISDRKEREQELHRFRSAVAHAGHGVVITETDGTIEYVNDSFEEMSGYSAAEAIGQTPAILKSGEHDRAFYRDLWETILNGEIWQDEVVNERKDGTQYIIDQTIAPLTTENGGIEGFVAVNRDITQLKEYEQELKHQNERLQKYGQTVAHDLRNPLGLIEHEIETLHSAVEGAGSEIDSTTVQDHCREIKQVLEQMERLVDELLTMAKQGQLVLEPEEVSLKEVADDAWKQVAVPTVWEADSETEAELAVEDAMVTADPDRLQELLSNLFRNAIEHGGDDVQISVGPLDFAPGFFVEDDGPGIPTDQREQIFERGYTTSDDGTGFGLAIVGQIAQAHDWAITVAEGTANGARFEFRITDSIAPTNDD